MDAIIYQSNTGFTKRYAEMLEEATGIPCLTQAGGEMRLDRGAEVIFMGWVMGGKITGYAEAAERYEIKAVVAVGVSTPGKELTAKLKKDNGIPGATIIFYLQGGVDYTKLKGVKKIMLLAAVKNMGKAMKRGAELSSADRAMYETMKNGGDFIREENISEIVKWCRKHQ